MKFSRLSSLAVVSVALWYMSSFVSIVTMSSAASFCNLSKFAFGFFVDPGGYDIGEDVGECKGIALAVVAGTLGLLSLCGCCRL